MPTTNTSVVRTAEAAPTVVRFAFFVPGSSAAAAASEPAGWAADCFR
jgi:hypothetical protein